MTDQSNRQKAEAIVAAREKATPGEWDNRCKELSNTARPRHIWDSTWGFIAECNSGSEDIVNAEFITLAANTAADVAKWAMARDRHATNWKQVAQWLRVERDDLEAERDKLLAENQKLREEREQLYADLIGQEHRLGTKVEVLENERDKLLAENQALTDLKNTHIDDITELREICDKLLEANRWKNGLLMEALSSLEALNTGTENNFSLRNDLRKEIGEGDGG